MLINEQIKLDTVKVVIEDKLVDMSLSNALNYADEQGMDLMLVQEEKGICKLGDYSKIKYQEKKAKKNNTKTVIKEIRLTPCMAFHDLQVKEDNVNRLLRKGNTKIKIVMKFKGRMNKFVEQGKTLMNSFVNNPEWKIEKPIQYSEDSLTCIITKAK